MQNPSIFTHANLHICSKTNTQIQAYFATQPVERALEKYLCTTSSLLALNKIHANIFLKFFLQIICVYQIFVVILRRIL